MSVQTRVQSLRMSAAGARPSAGARLPGTMYVNLFDFQLGAIDPSKNPIDLLAVRIFSSVTSYPVGSYVWRAGLLYRAIANVSPAAFNPSQWAQIYTSADVAGVYMPLAGGTFTGAIHAPSGSTVVGYMPVSGGNFTGPVFIPPGSVISGYMPVTGGIFTGPIVTTGGSTITGYMPVTGGTFTGAIHAPAGSTVTGYLPLSGGAMTGVLTLSDNPIDLMDAATKQYVDSFLGVGGPPGTGQFLPLTGGKVTGPIVLEEAGLGLYGAAGTANRVLTGFTGDPGPATRRWDLVMGTNLAETGANAGSNFGVVAYDDSGNALSSWNTNRASGRLTFNGVNAAPHTVANYPPDIGSATIVLNRSGSGHNCGIVASSGGLNRWALALSDAVPETGGNSGSNFTIQAVADDGHTALAELDINRMSGRMTLNGAGAAPHTIVAYPPDVGSATLVLN